MRTVVLSDLHLGSRNGCDLLSKRPVQERLFAELEAGDRVVLLGDLFELRHGLVTDIVERSATFFTGLNSAVSGGEIVYVPGNHDHRIIGGWIQEQLNDASIPVSLSESVRLDQLPALAPVSSWLEDCRLTVNYPGVWITPAIYATHGHYLDLHTTLPTLERIGLGLIAKRLGHDSLESLSPVDYEHVQARLYSWIAKLVDRESDGGSVKEASFSPKVWQQLQRGGLAGTLFGAGFLTFVAILNRLGVGPLNPDLSGDRLRSASVEAMMTVADCLQINADYILFGHTHRPGPLPIDDPQLWVTPGRRSLLMNTGSWIYDASYLSDSAELSPYWPGTYILVDGGDPVPQQRSLLAGLDRRELAAYVS